MIGITKLLCGKATVAQAMRAGHPSMLQFSADRRPIVVWNATYRCNLACAHCYLDADAAGADELTTGEARAMIDDLAALRTPVLLFSGGEPLMRADLPQLASYAAGKGLRPVVSTNGTLIDDAMAARLRDAGIQYAGISLDGAEPVHDAFRGAPGSFARAVEALRCCRRAGLKCGVRFTLNADNAADLPAVLDLVERFGVPRFCMYHLVYSGRGRDISTRDATPAQQRAAVMLLMEKALDWERRGVETEILTTDQHADGILVARYVQQHDPARAAEVVRLLRMAGGCSAGCKVANVDPQGGVHACQFWGHVTLGNVREKPFSRIWNNGPCAALDALRDKPPRLTGKCGSCAHKSLCGGCRIRAEAIHGDAWAEDPACYLTEAERTEALE